MLKLDSEQHTSNQQLFYSGIDAYSRILEDQKSIYSEIMSHVERRGREDRIYPISEEPLFSQIMEVFSPRLNQETAKQPLNRIYKCAFHKPSKSLVIANVGATLFCHSPKTATPHILRHIGLAVHLPGLGVEIVNVGIIGEIYSSRAVLRMESACSPSFLFGSQRCNCNHQWESIRELAAFFNPVNAPDTGDPDEFENWVKKQAYYHNGRHLFKNPGPGFIIMHCDCQNGMGSGYTDDEYVLDLYQRASIRHRGEYTSEQIFDLTMAGGFRAIGVPVDPRSSGNNMGYQLGPIVLDFLGVSKDLIVLTNNTQKCVELQRAGYDVLRVRSIGAVNTAGAKEARERGVEFGHLDINENELSFNDELSRLKTLLREHVSNGTQPHFQHPNHSK